MSGPEQTVSDSSDHEETATEETPTEPQTNNEEAAGDGDGSDRASVVSSELSSRATTSLLSIRSATPPSLEAEDRGLGLSKPWGFSDYDDYEYVD